MIQSDGIQLYVPDEILTARVGPDMQPLTSYIQAIEAMATQHWSARDTGDAKGLFVAVGVKANGASGSWTDAVAGSIEPGMLLEFDGQLATIPPPPIVGGPIAFALTLRLCDDPAIPYPSLPSAWSQYAESTGRGLGIPDELFAAIWPD